MKINILCVIFRLFFYIFYLNVIMCINIPPTLKMLFSRSTPLHRFEEEFGGFVTQLYFNPPNISIYLFLISYNNNKKSYDKNKKFILYIKVLSNKLSYDKNKNLLTYIKVLINISR